VKVSIRCGCLPAFSALAAPFAVTGASHTADQ
jgi:hypothetical protein